MLLLTMHLYSLQDSKNVETGTTLKSEKWVCYL